jgi:hypothetical protein
MNTVFGNVAKSYPTVGPNYCSCRPQAVIVSTDRGLNLIQRCERKCKRRSLSQPDGHGAHDLSFLDAQNNDGPAFNLVQVQVTLW